MTSRLLVVGHRGTGKTSLSRALGGEDLDEMVGRDWREDLAAFRLLEASALASALQDESLRVLSAGAGAVVSLADWFPEECARSIRAKTELLGWRVLWLRRDSDGVRDDPPGRPPRLSPEQHARREEFYGRVADEVLTVPDGLEWSSTSCPVADLARDVARGRIRTCFRDDVPGGLVLPHLRGEGRETTRPRGTHLELRDDLVGARELSRLYDLDDGAYLACRDPSRRSETEGVWRRGQALLDLPGDWPGALVPGLRVTRSWHDRLPGEPLQAVLERATSRLGGCVAVKVAVPVADARELALGHAWHAEEPERRAFLPRSPDGRWRWYRLAAPGPLAFTRRGRGTSPDQPTLLERLLLRGPRFEAVPAGRLCALAGRVTASGASPLPVPADSSLAPLLVALGIGTKHLEHQ